ncbi:MAG: ABC transporter permease [Thermoprotei archaeon]
MSWLSKHYGLSEFVHNKLGVVGLIIIAFFTFTAVCAPLLTSNSPNQVYVTGPWAVPQWATVFPQYSNLPPNMLLTSNNINEWRITTNALSTATPERLSKFPSLSSGMGSSASSAEVLFVNASVPYSVSTFSGATVASLSYSLVYTYKPPYDFQFGDVIYVANLSNIADFYFRFIISGPSGTYKLSSYSLMSNSPVEVISYRNGIPIHKWFAVSLSNVLPDVNTAALGPSGSTAVDSGEIYLSKKGNYTYTVQLVVIPEQGKTASLKIFMEPPYFKVLGRAYGLLGSDNKGRDLWSQFVYGSRISIEVGLLASGATVLIGTFLGLLSAVEGGLLDEFSMRVADVILVLPFLPLAIVVLFVFTQSPIVQREPSILYVWLVVLFSLLSWPGLARVIRSQALSLKERGYVEAARALGAGKFYIMNKHLLPNIMGLVYANLALSVPGFILTEASLDFLFPNASTIPTWGRMIAKAYEHAASATAYGFGWWWFLFPGIAIVLLSLAFVLLGYALDEIFNPRLRKR